MSDPATWNRPGWRAEVEDWIAARLREHGLVARRVDTARVRFWSITLTVETARGRYWFKENCPQQAFEAGLVDALWRVSPARVLEPTAVDRERGWILSADHGAVLGAAPVDLATWTRLLRDYAVLQREAAELDPVALGMTVLDPADAVAHLARRVDELATLPSEDPGRLAAPDAARLRRLGSTVAAYAERLAALGLPLTVDHSDLHADNAFAAPVGRPLRIFDFGDAVWSHPLTSLLVPTRAMTEDEGAGLTAAEAAGAVDAYLEVFSDLAPLPALRAAVPAGVELGRLNRQESWRRVLLAADPEAYAELGGAPAAWLSMLS